MATTWELDAYTVLRVSANGTFLPGVVYDPPSAGSQDLIWVEILNNQLVSQGSVPFINITATLYYNAVGSWTILCPWSETLWNQMMSGDFFVNVNWRGLFSFGGKCETPGYQDSLPGSVSAAEYAGPFITLSGADWMALIANRICYPAPGNSWQTQTGTSSDAVTNMNLESAIKHYVNGNIGPGAISARLNPYLTIATNQNRGPNVSYNVCFGTDVDLNLLDVLNALIVQSNSNMGMRITRNPSSHNLIFDVYIPSNLTSKAYFSETLGNVNAINFGITDPTCTDALVQGAATSGTASVFIVQLASGRTIWNMVEQFINDAGESTVANLNTDAANAIAQGQYGPIMQVTTNDLPFMTFGRDYYLGDLVTVQIQISGFSNATAATYTDIVSGVTLTADPTQTPEITVVPIIGNSTDPTNSNTEAIAQLTARIRKLEQRLAGRAL
jgi:Siphovirus ReqiPepy6 Gp37-like protein